MNSRIATQFPIPPSDIRSMTSSLRTQFSFSTCYNWRAKNAQLTWPGHWPLRDSQTSRGSGDSLKPTSENTGRFLNSLRTTPAPSRDGRPWTVCGRLRSRHSDMGAVYRFFFSFSTTSRHHHRRDSTVAGLFLRCQASRLDPREEVGQSSGGTTSWR